ncbi:hypothetical protein [Streptomyces fumanus]|uniref:hypothetical protein n=1 Tax=Streptomyces fumanus TaxID=67302 RepID=UPI003F4D4C0A
MPADPGLDGESVVLLGVVRGHGVLRPGGGVVVRLATLPDDGPTGGFFDEHGPVPW